MTSPRGNSSPPQSTGTALGEVEAAVPRNEHGGVLVTRDQIRSAFDFLDVDQRGFVTLENLKARLSIFYPDMTARDFRVLLNNASEVTEDDLCDLLLQNDVADYDPVADAFRAYDPDDTGYVSFQVLSHLFERLGYGSLSDDDLKVLVATADVDKDGRLNLADFRHLLAM
ncbi:hypothetical protein SPRG_05801 [Saprolegnia parasitica CBS 223.65]|uniref:EF-hand domain-containing protein n=1 Tax=Saprolegnia parasitica (strain CBS 223.65) TaxID=695850 RepID=A0A067CEJ3_SAPPC|nr:hypothetical protein SPRG_05801 [Saprolegnia parasitica CBS 223.65]KDO28928.1 hypothetical protein SPRG_05801 [Saprolegnia parasitica CBS 223.65]|eukprot:XP_012200469.1 hypothetical protein SPRG_05801 [Saprolegnia parasitica CBS 223.65]